MHILREHHAATDICLRKTKKQPCIRKICPRMSQAIDIFVDKPSNVDLQLETIDLSSHSQRNCVPIQNMAKKSAIFLHQIGSTFVQGPEAVLYFDDLDDQ